MKKKDYKAMIRHCNKLTRDGKELSITWDGGGDSGWFQMKLDDEPIDNLTDIEQEIVALIEDHIGYGSFAGDFSTTGQVTYSREEKCFQGEDEYTESTSDTHYCAIEISIPADLWFDRLQLRIEAEDMTSPAVTANLIIMNGMRIEEHTDWEAKIEDAVNNQLVSEIEKIEEYSGMWDEITMDFNSFVEAGQTRTCTIKEFDYSYYHGQTTEIFCSLTNQIN